MPHPGAPFHPPSRPASLRRGVTVLAAVLVLTLAAAAQRPASLEVGDGAEWIVTDAAGASLVGYGRVEGDALTIEVSRSGDLLLMMIGSDGQVHTWPARLTSSGTLRVGNGDGEHDLSDLLRDAGVSLRVRRVADIDEPGQRGDAGSAADPPAAGEGRGGPVPDPPVRRGRDEDGDRIGDDLQDELDEVDDVVDDTIDGGDEEGNDEPDDPDDEQHDDDGDDDDEDDDEDDDDDLLDLP